MNRQSGIVLKRFFSKTRKISLLDQQAGKIDCIPSTENICLGAIILYSKKENSRGLINDIETIALPMHLAQQDILFLHHLLELCYYFLPLETPLPEIFALIEFLYTVEDKPLTLTQKKLFLIKFFALLGIYPDDKKFRTPQFYRIASEPIDIMLYQGLDLMDEQYLNDWLLSCVRHHPDMDTFKTMRFLDIHRTV